MKMHKSILMAVAAAGMLIGASSIEAVQIGDTGTLELARTSGENGEGPLFTVPGGEFTVFNVTGAILPVLGSYAVDKSILATALPDPDFQTFCIEPTVNLGAGGVYRYVVNDRAMGSGNVLSLGTTWLYAQFATGGLPNYKWDNSTTSTFNSRADAAYDLQLAIWALEGYVGYGSTSAFYYQLAASLFADPTADDSTSKHRVYALNLTDSTGALTQDELVYVPDGGMSLMLLGMGLAGLSTYRRFKKA